VSNSLTYSEIRPFFGRYPAFFRVYLADVLSQIGQGMLTVAFPMFILEATHDVSLAGLAFSGEIAAYALLSPVAGHWADRVEQKSLMLTANVVRIVLLSLLLRLVSHAGAPLAGCLALSLGLGAAGALFGPARAAFLRRLLEGEDLLAAVALEGTSGFLVRLVAPASMGLLLIWFPPTAGL
jgi:DHA3 family macrolide efflux protein-like MFS transporter